MERNLPSNIPRHRQVVEQRAPLVGDPARAPAADLDISGEIAKLRSEKWKSEK